MGWTGRETDFIFIWIPFQQWNQIIFDNFHRQELKEDLSKMGIITSEGRDQISQSIYKLQVRSISGVHTQAVLVPYVGALWTRLANSRSDGTQLKGASHVRQKATRIKPMTSHLSHYPKSFWQSWQ